MKRTVVINVVGLTRRLIGTNTPHIQKFVEAGNICDISPVLPAVTCSAQSTYLTGSLPQSHGIVGNGWYFKDECEVKFWRQSNKLVSEPKIWEVLKAQNPDFTCANLFWWYNMYSSVDVSVTPRPNYLADGRKIPDIYSYPPEFRDTLQRDLGTFPLFHFWGPKADIRSSKWIAESAKKTELTYTPTLTLVYLPHLDYNLQRFGLDFKKIGKDLQEIDQVVGDLIAFYEHRGTQVILLSEYGITQVSRPVHLNRVLRSHGLLAVREERGLELMDAGASEAFAVADHQIAHIYVKNRSRILEIQELLQGVPGVDKILVGDGISQAGLNHERSGDLIVISQADSWFTYYYWEDDKKAPDFARMVDIHKKPGYDPVELFTNPDDLFVMPKIIGKLLKKWLGFRTLMNVIPIRPELVKGSHGRCPEDQEDYPIFISRTPPKHSDNPLPALAVFDELVQKITS
ncbi:alkaline phosphatase family protein [Robiginitalea sp.]|nr:alkaline phosphatase family protein [Robiginitalea sp.]